VLGLRLVLGLSLVLCKTNIFIIKFNNNIYGVHAHVQHVNNIDQAFFEGQVL